MPTGRNVAFLVVLAALPLSPAHAATLAEQLVEARGFERFGEERAVLIASGSADFAALGRDHAELDAFLSRVVAEARALTGSKLEPEERLHRVLHVHALLRFEGELGDVRVTIRKGDYNCLTGTTLFVLAARRLGIAASAYGMKQHVVPVIFGGDGARYLEMTDPEARLERRFTYPERRYRKALRGGGRAANAHLRGSAARIKRGMMTGDDADVLVEEKAETAAETAVREAREMRESTFDADPRGLAALLFWNRAVDGLFGDDPDGAVAMVDAVSRLGGRVLIEKTRHFRMAALDVGLSRVGARKGWLRSLVLVDRMLAHPASDGDRVALRALRVQVAEEMLGMEEASPETCKRARSIAAADPGNDGYQALIGWLCGSGR